MFTNYPDIKFFSVALYKRLSAYVALINKYLKIKLKKDALFEFLFILLSVTLLFITVVMLIIVDFLLRN